MALKKIIMSFTLILIFIFGAFLLLCLYLRLPMFGQLPHGKRLAKIEKSPNYRSGQFYNLHQTPVVIKNSLGSMVHFLFKNEKILRPSRPLPSIKTDLKNLDVKEDILIWFGHSSYFIQIKGKRILIDPLFSEVSSPIIFSPKAFVGTNVYKPEDIPEIDYLIITHDHWDHLDYETILKLKIKKIICPLGVGEHFVHWGFKDEQITEMDWEEEAALGDRIKVYCLPSRHFSGRGIVRNKTLWASFLIKTEDFKIYIGSDGGYDTHFSKIGKRFGPIDIAILDSGQHNKKWKYIHMMTDEVIRASKDLRAKVLLPSHICKLCLAYHPWDEPLKELSEMMKNESFSMLVPIIGEKIDLRAQKSVNSNWWKNIK